MSSYSSSIKAMIHGRRQRVPSSAPAHALLVALKDTPGIFSSLPFAVKEVEELHRLCKSMGIEPIQPGRRKQDILPYLPSCKIFHFAGHGNTNQTDPSKSQLLLEDGQDDPFTVATLIDMNLQSSPPFLAYLSACGTGRVEDGRFIDESLHLISACQIAGFRHVIGTLWEVNDQICVDMARFTYEGIKTMDVTDKSVCWGLHNASRKARDLWLHARDDAKLRKGPVDELATSLEGMISSRDKDQRGDRAPRKVLLVNEDDIDDDEPLYWVPYVHFGV
jgi:hypothetical protein